MSSNKVTTGVTKEISSFTGPAFGIEENGYPLLKVYDLPGVGDPKLPIALFIDDINRKIGSNQKIDAALIVLKLTDYRTSI